MNLAPHVSDQHVYMFHGQTSARVAIDVTSTLLNGRATVRVHVHPSYLACVSISEYCRVCGWSAGLQRHVPRNDHRCVNYHHEACDVHLCTISFDLWAPRYRFKNRHLRPPKICRFGFGRTAEKFADSAANSESVTTLRRRR